MALSALEITVFMAAVLLFIYSIYNLVTYKYLSEKASNMDTNKYNDTCGVKHGTVTSGMGFSVVMLIVSLLVMFWYGIDIFHAGKAAYNKIQWA